MMDVVYLYLGGICELSVSISFYSFSETIYIGFIVKKFTLLDS